jgi:hypothetical protein
MSKFIDYVPRQYPVCKEGVHQGVLADAEDLGVQETGFGPKRKVLFWWLLDETGEDGRPIICLTSYTASLHPASALFKVLTIILGEEPGRHLDLEALRGINAMLFIQHHERDGVKKMFVESLTGLPDDREILLVPTGFVPRGERRKGKKGQGPWADGKNCELVRARKRPEPDDPEPPAGEEELPAEAYDDKPVPF